MILKTGELVTCPHCGGQQEEPVEDFVIPGRVGDSSFYASECDHCDEKFSVKMTSVGVYVVQPLE